MNDNSYEDKPMYASLTKGMYSKIEKKVVDFYKELKIDKMPIDPFYIAYKKGYKLLPVSSKRDLKNLFRREGFSGLCYRGNDGVFRIVYDDAAVIARQRFTIMHEIGHIVLGHKEESDLADKMANYFAAYALAPSPLVGLYNCEDYIDVVNVFNVSKECADTSFRRFINWQMYCPRKDYENELISMFTK